MQDNCIPELSKDRMEELLGRDTRVVGETTQENYADGARKSSMYKVASK